MGRRLCAWGRRCSQSARGSEGRVPRGVDCVITHDATACCVSCCVSPPLPYACFPRPSGSAFVVSTFLVSPSACCVVCVMCVCVGVCICVGGACVRVYVCVLCYLSLTLLVLSVVSVLFLFPACLFRHRPLLLLLLLQLLLPLLLLSWRSSLSATGDRVCTVVVDIVMSLSLSLCVPWIPCERRSMLMPVSNSSLGSRGRGCVWRARLASRERNRLTIPQSRW